MDKVDKTVVRWRALVDIGELPKAIDLGIFEQLWGERLDSLSPEQAGSRLALLRAVSCIEVDPDCYYFGGPSDGPPSKGHTVTLRRHLDFWYGDPAWTAAYLRRILTPPPDPQDYSTRIERAPFVELASFVLDEARSSPSLGGDDLNKIEAVFRLRWPAFDASYAGRLTRSSSKIDAEHILRAAESDFSRAPGENEALRTLFRDRWERPSFFRR